MTNYSTKIKIRGDRVIWAVMIILAIISLLAVYSSSGSLAYRYHQGNTEYFLFKQLVILGIGLVIIYVIHHINYTILKRIYPYVLLGAVFSMLLTWFFGTTINDATRWYNIPIVNISFQPSEYAKIALVIYLSFMLKRKDALQDWPHIIVLILTPIAIISGLIVFSDFSTAGLLLITSFVMMFASEMKFKYLGSLAGTGLVFLGIILLLAYTQPDYKRFGTWKGRIESFINPGEKDNYQVNQAKIAIATGGIMGKLPGNSTQRNFLPQAYSDFIFAIIIEEYGILGGSIVVLLYLIFFYRAIRIVTKIGEKLPSYLVIGLSFMVVFQGLLNMAVATNLLPVTGQPLPMVSMGGTSIWFTSLAIGIILNISREIDEYEPGKNVIYA